RKDDQMKIKTTFAALALILAPGLALAEGCRHDNAIQDANMSCAAGTTFDAATKTCVPGTTS
ncbi:MAG: carbohydrate-binding module family 14 protein, partial [Paracoccaceae bacterium]